MSEQTKVVPPGNHNSGQDLGLVPIIMPRAKTRLAMSPPTIPQHLGQLSLPQAHAKVHGWWFYLVVGDGKKWLKYQIFSMWDRVDVEDRGFSSLGSYKFIFEKEVADV